jgi:hypothetical protein
MSVMNSRRLMCCPQPEDRTLPHRLMLGQRWQALDVLAGFRVVVFRAEKIKHILPYLQLSMTEQKL